MANYKGHLVGAVTVCAVYVGGLTILPGNWAAKSNVILSNWQAVAAIFIIACLFGLWPDIDTNSKAQDIFFAIAFAADIALIVVGRFEAAAYLGLMAMTPIVGKHRGWTHSKLACLLVPLPLALVPYLYQPRNFIPGLLFYGAALAGYFSHLLLDGLIWKRIHVKGGSW
jgi:membrane-bound metal-dependent hydrolase YbcI (DUF457 family)